MNKEKMAIWLANYQEDTVIYQTIASDISWWNSRFKSKESAKHQKKFTAAAKLFGWTDLDSERSDGKIKKIPWSSNSIQKIDW